MNEALWDYDRNCDCAENTFGDEQFNFPLGNTQKT